MAQDITLPVIIFGSIAGTATLTGVFLLTKKEDWARKNSHFINSFAAGVILALALFHLMPEALELNEFALVYVFIGFIVFYLLESVLILHSGAEIHYMDKAHIGIAESLSEKRTKGIVVISGLGFHSLIDGIIIGVGFEVSTSIGLLTSLGVILHEFPEGITSVSILLDAGMDKLAALRYSIIVAVATPIGSIGSLIFVLGVSEVIIGALLAIAAGTFLYVSASDLIPETHERDNKKHAVILLGGVAFLYLLTVALG
ncbi:MAG: ZIP family metal transporter [Promethearchaeota archaeon]